MLAASLALFAAAYVAGLVRVWRHAGRGCGIGYANASAFALGWISLVVALAPPLDRWADTLFVAHMVQHELLMVVAAPLIAFSTPLLAMLWALPSSYRRSVAAAAHSPVAANAWTALTEPATVWLLHGAVIWIWHLPALFDLALAHDDLHAVQHLTFYLTAILFWWSLLHGRYGRAGYGAAVVYLFATGLHTGLLGALMTVSTRVWYEGYASQTPTWNIAPLADQQMAGLVMWIPAGLIFVAGGLAFFAAWLRESEHRIRRHGAIASGDPGRAD